MEHGGHESQRFAEHSTRCGPVTFGIFELRLRTEQHRRMMTDPERDRCRLATRMKLAQVARVVTRGIRKPGHALRTLNPTTLNGRVVDTRIRIVGRGMGRGQIGTGFEFVLRQHGQLVKAGLGALQHDFLHRGIRARDAFGFDRGARTGREPLCGLAMIGNAERLGGQFTTRRQIEYHRNGRRLAAEGRHAACHHHGIATLPIERVLQRRQVVAYSRGVGQLPNCLGMLGKE
jgi:hypothetical protein